MPRQAPRPTRGRRATKLGKRLTAARLAAGLTQAQLAEKLGVGVTSLRRWEYGDGAPRGLYAKVVESFLKESSA